MSCCAFRSRGSRRTDARRYFVPKVGAVAARIELGHAFSRQRMAKGTTPGKEGLMTRRVRRHERRLRIVSTVFVGANIAPCQIGFCGARNVGADRTDKYRPFHAAPVISFRPELGTSRQSKRSQQIRLESQRDRRASAGGPVNAADGRAIGEGIARRVGDDVGGDAEIAEEDQGN